MVIILQQTMDNGKRFVSTVVEEESFNSTFSVNSSHNSISERSAIYKQRIDSLFGRHTRLNPFKPTLEPFVNRHEDKNHEIVSGETQPSSALLHHHRPLLTTSCKPATPAQVSTQKFLCNSSPTNIISSEDENDDYEKIEEKSCSIITDSLTHSECRKNRSCSESGYSKECSKSSSVSHVSSVRLNCEEADHISRSSNPLISNSMDRDRDMGNKAVGESHMWRNGTYGESPCSSEERQYGIVRTTPGGILKFSVEYLGSIPVDGTTTALQDLQAPLRNLYMNYLSGTNLMSGQLSITSDGLRFEAPKVRLVNPFATIAVWAAIKFVAHGEPNPMECAFMPLISDPEGQDKSRLFGRMSPELSKAYKGCVSGHRAFRNPPIFACVMREASFSLDCHAFACKCAEDAIVIAANLYQSLVDKMRTANKEGESGYGSLTRNSPANQSQSSPNENRSCSSASSQGSPRLTSGNSSSSGGGREGSGHSEGTCQDLKSVPKPEHRVVFSDSESVAPIRPPRRKKKSSDGIPSNLKRYNSDDSVLLKLPHRRKSLKGNCHSHYGKAKKRVQISTPDETTSSESINESIDQVLDRIINPGGMSFNDLKPSYQELILKIALTLTQDQLYQKSKQAMKKHQQYNMRKKSNKNPDLPEDNSQFLNLLLKSFSKITSGKAPSNNQVKRKGNKSAGHSKLKPKTPPKVILKKTKEEDPFTSFCSGCVCENCSDKCYCSLPSKHNVKMVGLPPTPSNGSTATTLANMPNDQCQDPKNLESPRKKPCGYDTDSCAESEKCYCSLQRVKSNGLKIYNINLDTETSDTDTNSYDFEPFHAPSKKEPSGSNLKSVAGRSVEILSYHPAKRLMYNRNSGTTLHTTNALVHFDDKRSPGSSSHTNCNGNSKGSTRNHSAASSSYSHSSQDDLLSDSSNGHQRNKVLLITGSSPSTRVVYKEQYHESRKSHRSQLVDINEDESTEESRAFTRRKSSSDEGRATEKILSMKKTAEIAAMFTDLHLDQTTNLVATSKSEIYRESVNTTETSNTSLDFEASLGYLP
ncbi:unnamed protein product [Allacma fusca]|uniref:PID domain-containing protein n=1 Tax=Allacma fusca TaxID=39272 RepID=A0A8J2Q5H4_9HEXA|nr:unnamed protein product [Allacma fusca]